MIRSRSEAVEDKGLGRRNDNYWWRGLSAATPEQEQLLPSVAVSRSTPHPILFQAPHWTRPQWTTASHWTEASHWARPLSEPRPLIGSGLSNLRPPIGPNLLLDQASVNREAPHSTKPQWTKTSHWTEPQWTDASHWNGPHWTRPQWIQASLWTKPQWTEASQWTQVTVGF